MHGECANSRGCIHVCECVCLCGDCVVFVCVPSRVCIVIVRVRVCVCMFANLCVCIVNVLCLYASLAMFVL